MVSALRDQKIRRRGGKHFTTKTKSGNKNSLLTTLFFVSAGLLICASIFFSIAMIDSKEKMLELPEVSLAAEEVRGGGRVNDAGEFLLALNESNHFADQENLINDSNSGESPGLADDERIYIPPVHIVKPGNTISSISKDYNISIYELIKFNKITDPTKLQLNEAIYIPQGVNNVKNAAHIPSQKKEDGLPETIEIEADKISGTAPLSVRFKLKTEVKIGSPIYIWDLGADRFEFSRDAEFTYEKPGKYKVFLMLSDQENNEVTSNNLTITVKSAYKNVTKVSKRNSNAFYLTMNGVNEVLDLTGYFKSASGSEPSEMKDIIITQSLEMLKPVEPGKFLVTKSGYGKLSMKYMDKTFNVNLFVSPVPTIHVFEPDFDWYKTQFKTGFNGNCGPACVAMAIHWAKNDPVTVAQIRTEIGYPIKNGALTFSHMLAPIQAHKANAFFTTVKKADDLRKIIDRGNIAIMLYHTGYIKKPAGNSAKTMVGRYYNDTTGHYTIIKGYTKDEKYFVVYDPIPGDWVENEVRYDDSEVMLGRNRYYPASEVLKSLKKSHLLEISRG